MPGLVGDGTAGTATELTVTAQPPAVATGAAFGLTVVAEDAAGTMDPTYNGPVTISLANNPGGSTLGGTLTATAVDGVATFTNLTLNQPGTGYTLQATATGLSTATTSSFNVVAAPVVTPSGTTNIFTVGGAAVAVDSGLTVSSSDADLSGATVTISAGTLQSGDTLNFTNQNGISGSYSGGVLTLTGSATPAQYQTALQSVTFSTTSTNTTTRSISIVAERRLARRSEQQCGGGERRGGGRRAGRDAVGHDQHLHGRRHGGGGRLGRDGDAPATPT